MKRLSLLALAGIVLAGGTPVSAQDIPPYIGVWDCGVGVFTFTRDSYNNGSDIMPATDITVDGNTFVFTFEDGYQIGVSMHGDDAMQWVSMESGDMFDCTRLYY